MAQAQPIITTSRVEAYAASALRLLGWLLGVVLRIGASGRGMRLGHLLNRAEHAIECILFLKAVAIFGPLPEHRNHPRSAPNGFRRVVRKGGPFFRSVNIRARKAGALTRVLALIDALIRPERAVAYFLKQICKGVRGASLVAAAPPAQALSGDVSTAAAIAWADTS